MSNRYRTHATTFFTPPRLARRERRSQAKAARTIGVTARRRAGDETRSRAQALADERHAAHYLPAGGEDGPAALRSHKRFRVPPHRATSEVLAGDAEYASPLAKRPYDLRHAAVSTWLNAGVLPTQVAE